MRIRFIVLGLILSVSALAQNTLSDTEKKDGWKLLFDGKTTQGWHSYLSDKVSPGWKVADGALYLDTSIKAGDIITDGEWEDYEFSIDWKIEPCGNSGIIFNVTEDKKYPYPWLTGPEMQILDNTCHDDGKIVKHRAGNLYDLIASAEETVKPAGEWNTAVIRVKKGVLELYLNGVLQVKTTMFDANWESMIKGSKFKDMPAFGKTRKGKISLQDHGNKVWLRNIKVRSI